MDKCIRELEVEMFERAKYTLLTPQDKSEFGYGQAAGFYQGMARAVEFLRNYAKGIEDEEKNS